MRGFLRRGGRLVLLRLAGLVAAGEGIPEVRHLVKGVSRRDGEGRTGWFGGPRWMMRIWAGVAKIQSIKPQLISRDFDGLPSPKIFEWRPRQWPVRHCVVRRRHVTRLNPLSRWRVAAYRGRGYRRPIRRRAEKATRRGLGESRWAEGDG